jgi:tetratricopeptide (TPR) repeat protein
MKEATSKLLQEADRLHRQGALAEAASRYREVLQDEPDHAAALYHLAVIACQQGDLHAGVELVRRSLASNSRDPRAQNLLGMALGRLGRPLDALACFDGAIIDQPDFADAHGNRANMLMELGRVDEAVTSYQRALALEPASIGDRLNLGTALHRLGRYEEALANLDQVLAVAASIPEVHFNRGNALANLARYEEALASYDRALAINRRHADALAARAHVLIALGRMEGALANFEEATTLAPEGPQLLGQLADALLEHGEVARVLAAAARAVALRESDETKALFARCIRKRTLTSEPGGVRALVLRALSEPWESPEAFAVPAASLIKLNPAVKEACARAARAWPRRLTLEDLTGCLTAIVDDELLRVALETVPLRDVELERCLAGIRSILLEAARESPATVTEDALFRFCCALARQCFVNSYALESTAEEIEQVRRLRARLEAAADSGVPVPPFWIVVTAAYVPLHTLTGMDILLGRSWPESLAAVLMQQVREAPDQLSDRAP